MYQRIIRTISLVAVLLAAIVALGGAVGVKADNPISTQSYVANNGDSTRPVTNPAGYFIVYQTKATGLLSNGQPLNGHWQIVQYNRDVDGNGIFDEAGWTETTLVSGLSNGTQANADAVNPSISSGAIVAYESAATNLTSQGGNGGKTLIYATHIYGVDLISKAYGEYPANSAHGAAVADNWETAYYFDAGNGHPEEVWMHIFWSNTDVMVSRRQQGGIAATGNSRDPSISADGCSIAYSSYDLSLDPNHTESAGDNDSDIFVYYRDGFHLGTCSDAVGEYTVVRLSLRDGWANTTGGNSYSPSISPDGRYVTFVSDVQLTAADTNSRPDAYVYDRDPDGNGWYDETGSVSIALASGSGNGNSYNPVVLYPWVAFDTSSSDYVSFDANGSVVDIGGHRVYDGLRTIFSSYQNSQGQGITGNGDSSYPALSSEGAVFQSKATDLVAGDSADTYNDIFAYNKTQYKLVKVSVPLGGDVPDVVDSGFRPNPNGYSFQNFAPSTSDFTLADMRAVFGDSVCKSIINGNCYFTQGAMQVYKEMATLPGNCFGLSATSLRLYGAIDSYGSTTFNLTKSEQIKKYLAKYSVRQYDPDVHAEIEVMRKKTLLEILSAMSLGLSSGSAYDYPVLVMFGSDGESAHAVTPYALERLGNGDYTIWAYDNEFPQGNHRGTDGSTIDEHRQILVSPSLKTWKYFTEWNTPITNPDVWQGTESMHTLSVVKLSTLEGVSLPAQKQIWIEGDVHGLVINGSGQRVGYAGGNFINEISGASIYEQITGLNVHREPRYEVPTNGSYTINLDGSTISSPLVGGISFFDNSYGGYVNNIPMLPGKTESLHVDPISAFSYTPSTAQSVNIGAASDNGGESVNFDVTGADVGAAKTLRIGAEGGWATYDNGSGPNGTYDVQIRVVDSSGEHVFAHSGISVNSNDTEFFNYGQWDGSGKMEMQIDHGHNGTIDQSIQLDNQFSAGGKVYLPIVIK